MKRRDLLVLGAGALAASLPAHAGGGGKDEKEDKDARIVELKNAVFPIGDSDGRLVNYFFVDVELHVVDAGRLWSLREDAHLLRDSLIRASHRTSLGVKDKPDTFDVELANKVCLEALAQDGFANAFSRATFPKADSRRRFDRQS
jgi:hypothetical protein